MRLVIVPGCTLNDTPASATTPPNSTPRFSTTSTLAPPPRGERRYDAARKEEHEEHEHHAVGQHLPLPGDGLAQRLRQHGEEEGADHGPASVPWPPAMTMITIVIV